MTAAWATPTELASLLQRPALDNTTADLLLKAAADEIRAECQQSIDIASTVEVLDGPPNICSNEYGNSVIWLTERPVRSVTTVTEIPSAGGSPVTLVAGTDYVLGKGGRLYRMSGSAYIPWTTRKMGISVTYEHGWDIDSWQYGLAKTVSLQSAGRAYINPEALHQKRVGDFAVRYFGTTTPITGLIQLTEFERTKLDPLRKNLMG